MGSERPNFLFSELIRSIGNDNGIKRLDLNKYWFLVASRELYISGNICLEKSLSKTYSVNIRKTYL